MTWIPSETDSPFDRIGGEAAVRALAAAFYEDMDENEPELARLHPLDEHGKVAARSRESFAAFLVEWLGGPRAYSPVHGHPRLRMRHGRVAVNVAMRDAWVRSMKRAMDRVGIQGEVRAFLDLRFAEVADFLRNAEG